MLFNLVVDLVANLVVNFTVTTLHCQLSILISSFADLDLVTVRLCLSSITLPM